MKIHTIYTYKSDVMPHGIKLKETLTYDTNAPPHWKGVLQAFANF